MPLYFSGGSGGGGGSGSGAARVRAATTAAITITTALNNGDTLDGVTLATDDLVLVKDQADATQNGVWKVGVSPARAAGFNTWDEIAGAFISVMEGTVNADTLWLNLNDAGGSLGVTSITFGQRSYDASNLTEVTATAVTTLSTITGNALTIATLDSDKDINITPHGNGQILANKHIVLANNFSIRTGTTAGSVTWQAYDLDNTTYRQFILMTAGNTPTLDLSAPSGGTVTINATSIGATTPGTGAFTTISATGQITSTLANGTAPLVIASSTNVANLNASSLGGATFAAPGAIGGGTPSTGAFTTLNASGVATLASGTATPAGGSSAARLLFGTTAGFGIYYGSGAPSSLTAGQGSLYLRSDGTGVNDRAYINNSSGSGTTWTALVTVA